MAGATVQTNLMEFRRDIAAYVKASGKAVADVVNQKAFFIARHALKSTPKALRGKILAELGASSNRPIQWKGNKLKGKPLRITKTKSGKIKARRPSPRLIPGNTVAINIVQQRRADAGLPPLKKVQAKRAALRMINSKLKAIGTLKAGWVGVINDFYRAAKKDDANIGRPDTVKQVTGGMGKVRGKGMGQKAKPGFISTAVGKYRLQKDHYQGVHPAVIRALNIAINIERQGMAAYMLRKMAEAGKSAAKNGSLVQ